eukprot:TRINITY_DN34412_c0_g1_i1.p1 TRINITY_DN34412_c0_g1~~TRINITY_DN34412_c0_g1_i1.p1  ORF type:complete len:299 (+),score=28.26 TRINITY_DN34412_c0_g1_i1:91-897(+)
MAKFAHVPKRVAQHGIFVSAAEAPPTILKPGQTDVAGVPIFTEEAKPHRETYLTQDQNRESVYTTALGRQTLPEEYLNPPRRFRPHHISIDQARARASTGTRHWESEYKAAAQKGPLEFGSTTPRVERVTLSGVCHAGDTSSYTQEFGKYGSNPLDRLSYGSTKLPVLRHSLNFGTTKGTNHLPGYQGYVPFHAGNAPTARVQDGARTRSTDKTNITQTYHVKLVGYAGHQPENAYNDRYATRCHEDARADKVLDGMTPRQAAAPHMA